MIHPLFSRRVLADVSRGVLLLFLMSSSYGQELESTRLKNTISHGSGEINLLKAQGNKDL